MGHLKKPKMLPVLPNKLALYFPQEFYWGTLYYIYYTICFEENVSSKCGIVDGQHGDRQLDVLR